MKRCTGKYECSECRKEVGVVTELSAVEDFDARIAEICDGCLEMALAMKKISEQPFLIA